MTSKYRIPDIPVQGTWHELTKNYDIQSTNQELKVDLGGWEAQVFVWQEF